MKGRIETVKVKFECPSCLLNRAQVESERASSDPSLRLETLMAAVREIGCHITPDVTPSYLGTIRDRTIKKVSGNPDPFRIEKITSNDQALKLTSHVRKYVQSGRNRSEQFRRACLASIVGNAFEFGIKGYDFRYENLPRMIETADHDLAIDDIGLIESLVAKSKNMLLLTDNAGEIAFDKILVEYARQMGAYVVVAVKAAPISNDATMEDANAVGMAETANRVITTGTDSVGLQYEECSKEFVEIYSKSDLIIAKGMAHYETLSEMRLHRPHALMFRVKCGAIANDLAVDLGKNVAFLVKP